MKARHHKDGQNAPAFMCVNVNFYRMLSEPEFGIQCTITQCLARIHALWAVK